MSSGKRKAPDSGEPGESEVFLLSTPTTRQKGSGGLPEAERGGKGRQGLPSHHGASSLCSLAGVPAPPPPPAMYLSQHCRHRAGSWEQPSGTHKVLTAAHICSFLFSVCVLCGRADVDPDICGRTFAKSGICVHEFCLVSSSKGSFQLPATDAPFLSGLVKSCTFLSYRFLQLAFMVKEPHGRELVGSLFMLSDAQPSMQIRR